jgi:hypothetical protein
MFHKVKHVIKLTHTFRVQLRQGFYTSNALFLAIANSTCQSPQFFHFDRLKLGSELGIFLQYTHIVPQHRVGYYWVFFTASVHMVQNFLDQFKWDNRTEGRILKSLA